MSYISSSSSSSSSSIVQQERVDTEIIIITDENFLEEAKILFSELLISFKYIKISYTTEDLSQYRKLRALIFSQSYGNEIHVNIIRQSYPMLFIALFRPEAAEQPSLRLSMFEAGVNMVAHDIQSLTDTLQRAVIPSALTSTSRKGNMCCPYCGLSGLTEDDLWNHFPAFHINWPNIDEPIECPICHHMVNDPLQVHIHETHGPIVRKTGRIPYKIHAKSYTFSLVVCKHPLTHKYLLCQEFANQGYWLPGGAVDAGETLQTAAIRETQEEAGINIELKGILALEYDVRQGNRGHSSYIRMRIIFYAEPIDLNQLPKSSPDFESVGACWCSEQEIKSILKLRGNEVILN